VTSTELFIMEFCGCNAVYAAAASLLRNAIRSMRRQTDRHIRYSQINSPRVVHKSETCSKILPLYFWTVS